MRAARGEQHIGYFPEAVVGAPVGTLVGLFLSVFGAKGWEVLSNWCPSKLAVVLIIVFTLIFGLGSILGRE